MIRLARPNVPPGVLADLERILSSGQLIQGEEVDRFELALAGYLDVPAAVAVSSGTAALHLAMLALGIGPGDEVIVPAFTFPAPANAVELVGARPVFVDINLDDCCMSAEEASAAVTEATAVLMPVHEFGQSADLDPLLATASRHGLAFVEDAACALGTEYRGRKVGTFGDLGCFSFHPRKALTTGEGGLLVGSAGLLDRVRTLRNHGIVMQEHGTDFIAAGLNARMTEFQAAIGFSQVPCFEQTLARRAQLADFYDEKLAALPGVRIPRRYPERRHAYQTYHLILPSDVNRDAVIAHGRRRGVELGYGAQALNCLSFFRGKYGLNAARFPNATRAYRSGLALPIGDHVSDDDCATVVATVVEALSA